MGVNVVIDAGLLAEAMERGGLGSQEATVEEALKRLIADFRGKQAIEKTAGIGWEGDLEAMREERLSEAR